MDVAKTASLNSQTWLFMIYIRFFGKRVKTQILRLKQVCWCCSKHAALVHFAWSHLLTITFWKRITIYWFKLAAPAAIWPDAMADCNILYQNMAAVSFPTDLSFLCILQPKLFKICSLFSFSHVMSNPCPSAAIGNGEVRGPNQECPQLHLWRRVKFHLTRSVDPV